MRWLSGGGSWSHGAESGHFARANVSSARDKEQLGTRGCSRLRHFV
ncbi:hypothetical protein [Bartonella massiliensis]|nr:hypothetical protein [Bartonella massiliensis]